MNKYFELVQQENTDRNEYQKMYSWRAVSVLSHFPPLQSSWRTYTKGKGEVEPCVPYNKTMGAQFHVEDIHNNNSTV